VTSQTLDETNASERRLLENAKPNVLVPLLAVNKLSGWVQVNSFTWTFRLLKMNNTPTVTQKRRHNLRKGDIKAALHDSAPRYTYAFRALLTPVVIQRKIVLLQQKTICVCWVWMKLETEEKVSEFPPMRKLHHLLVKTLCAQDRRTLHKEANITWKISHQTMFSNYKWRVRSHFSKRSSCNYFIKLQEGRLQYEIYRNKRMYFVKRRW